MITFHSLHVAPKQDYLHSIHFYSFPFLYFKTSNQGCLIPFHSIFFPYLNTLHSIPFHSLMIIQLHSLMNSQTKPYRYIRGIIGVKILGKQQLRIILWNWGFCYYYYGIKHCTRELF